MENKYRAKVKKRKFSAGQIFGGASIFGGLNFGEDFRRKFVPPKILGFNVFSVERSE